MQNVTFLVCSERSGSNMIRAIMDAHSQVYSPAPMHLAWCIYHAYRAGDLEQDGNWHALVQEFHQRFISREKFVEMELDITELLNVQPRTPAALYSYIHTKGMKHAGKSHCFIKENHTCDLLPAFVHAFPNAKYAFQVRDPRDVMLSCKKISHALPYLYPLPQATLVWEDDQTKAAVAYHNLDADKVFIYRYEDLVKEPECVIRSLCEFIGVPFERSVLQFHTRGITKKSSDIDGWKNLDKPIMSENTGKYRKGLLSIEIRTIENRLRDLMKLYGYTPDFPEPGRFTKAALRLYWYSTWALAFLSGRLSLTPGPKVARAYRFNGLNESIRYTYQSKHGDG